MVGQPWRLGALHQRFQTPQVIAIERFGRTEVHGHAMLHHLVLFEYLIEDGQRTPAIHHVVLRDNLKPAHHRLFLQDVLVVRNAEAYANTVIGESVESICRHLFMKKMRSWRGSPAWSVRATNADGLTVLLGTVGRAAALALAGVLGLAAVVAGLAAALTLAGVLPLTGMLVLLGFPDRPGGLARQRTAGGNPLAGGARGDGVGV